MTAPSPYYTDDVVIRHVPQGWFYVCEACPCAFGLLRATRIDAEEDAAKHHAEHALDITEATR